MKWDTVAHKFYLIVYLTSDIDKQGVFLLNSWWSEWYCCGTDVDEDGRAEMI